MELQQMLSDVLWTGTLLLLILKAEQHVNLRKECTQSCTHKIRSVALKMLNSDFVQTCSWGGERNSLVLRAVRAADMLSACMTSLYRKR